MKKNSTKPICWFVFLAILYFLSGYAAASQQDPKKHVADSQEKQTDTEHQSPVIPDLNDIIPLATSLSGRFADLKNDLNQIPDFSPVEQQFAEIGAEMEALTGTFTQIKVADDTNLSKLYALRSAMMVKKGRLEKVSQPLEQEISRIDDWKVQWLSTKSRWLDWQSSLFKGQEPEQLKQGFKKATDIIDTALNLITLRLDKMLALQAKGGIAGEALEVLEADVRARISITKHRDMYSKTFPMFSRGYYSQFTSAVWHSVIGDLELMISRPISGYLTSHGWVALLQIIGILVLLNIFYRNYDVLKKSEHWRFLVERPFSSALYIVIMFSLLFIAYESIPEYMRLVYQIVGSIATVRLLSRVIIRPLRRQVAYVVMVVFVVSQVIDSIGLPLILSRLYILLTSLVVLLFLYNCARKSLACNETGFFVSSIRAFAGLFSVLLLKACHKKQEIWRVF